MGKGQELLAAAREGDVRNVEKILGQITKRSGPFPSLRRGAGVNVQDDNGYTALHHACLNRHKEIVHMLLSVDASPCIVDKKGLTPLHCAAFTGEVDIVTMLLSHNNPPVNINQQTTNQETALLLAAQFGYKDIVLLLISKGADVSIKNKDDETALDLAARFGKTEIVRHLLRVCPQLVAKYKCPSSRGQEFTNTPLHIAAKAGHAEIVVDLLNVGIRPNISTHRGTPLHEAAFYGKATVVGILLDNGADLNAVNIDGKTVIETLELHSKDAFSRVRKVIKEHERMSRHTTYESEDEPPSFPVSPTYPQHGLKARETEKSTNKVDGLLFSSSTSLTKNHPQSFVKKLASKCLGLKAKFSSVPNISNTSGLESEVSHKLKQTDQKNTGNTNTLHIGNSKFFKMLLKKEESGDIICTDEFDTISLDRLGTLNRDSVVNRSNRSCPGFKTSLPNISENNELSDSESNNEFVPTELDSKVKNELTDKLTEAVNNNAALSNIFEPREKEINSLYPTFSDLSRNSANFVNECYESYEFSSKCAEKILDSNNSVKPIPPPRQIIESKVTNENTIYENVTVNRNVIPTPATRSHIPTKAFTALGNKIKYENVSIKNESSIEPIKSTVIVSQLPLCNLHKNVSPSLSRSSTSSDSMIDETNLEDILLSQKSRSFRHGHKLYCSNTKKTDINRTQSNASDFTDVTDATDITEASALENVDCSDDVIDKSIYLSMTGTLPVKKAAKTIKKKVLFRNKTFTNIEVDRNSINFNDLPKWNTGFLKETLANYHIRGTGHCIYKAPTVQEFIFIFNRDTLYKDSEPFTKMSNNKRDSYYETAICFCKPAPPKHHRSFEDLLKIKDEPRVLIDLDSLIQFNQISSTSFRCFCDSKTCKLHFTKRVSANDLIVKFSALKKSISTPDITLDLDPSSASTKKILVKNKSVPYNLESPYAVVNVNDIIRNKSDEIVSNRPSSPIYTTMSNPSTITSSASAELYSIKDIAEVFSLNSTSPDTDQSFASEKHLPLRKSSSEYSGHWSLHTCSSNATVKSDASFKTCIEESESSDDGSDGTLHTEEESSDAETIKSDASTTKRPWVHTDSFRFGNNDSKSDDVICEIPDLEDHSTKIIFSHDNGNENSSSEDSGIPRVDSDVSLGIASLERGSGMVGDVRSGSGRRRWDELEGTSEGDALSVSSAASSCAPHHLAHHLDYSKVSPTPPKKPPRRNLSVSPTHANSPSSAYSYELRSHARSQDDLDDIQGGKIYLKHGRSVDQYVDGKLSYSEYEENHNSPRIAPVPHPRPSLKNRYQPVAITAMYENVVIKQQNPRRKLRRNNFGPQHESGETRMNDSRVRKYSNQEKSSLESLLDNQSMNSPSDCERYYDGTDVPLSPTHYDQPPTPDHPPPSARQAENSIHERIRPLSQLIMEVVEEIRIRKKSQGDISDKT